MMYPFLLFLHSFWRWLVFGSLTYSIYLAYVGRKDKSPFTTTVNQWRHWTATISHIQLILGMAIYVQSPIVMFRILDNPHKLFNEQSFFRYFHLAMMMLAVVLITIGSAKAKRQKSDQQKYATMFIWFIIALIIIIIAIPWPFSPLTSRPYIRGL